MYEIDKCNLPCLDFHISKGIDGTLESTINSSRLPGKKTASGCPMGRKKADGGCSMLQTMYCWETLGQATQVDVTLTLTTFMVTVIPNGGGLF